MLAKWVNVLPLFVVRWLALRYCERFPWHYEGRVKRTMIAALPDCHFKVDGALREEWQPDANERDPELGPCRDTCGFFVRGRPCTCAASRIAAGLTLPQPTAKQ